jgi:murein DD-endopeptidase MepM/ murein hydrolase activator NlpD
MKALVSAPGQGESCLKSRSGWGDRGHSGLRWYLCIGWEVALAFLILLVAITACQSQASKVYPSITGVQESLETTTIATATESPEDAIAETPTAVFIPQENPTASQSQLRPTAAPDPLRFNFPDTPPDPVSAWRPPLYPVPWAPTPYDHFYFARPIAADEVNWPLANYRYGGVFFEDVVHTGVDIPASKGTPVIAAGDGKVVWAGWGLYRGIYDDRSDPYGQAVVIRHDFGYRGHRLYTVYGHLDRVDVTRGQHVDLGDQLGLVGETGFVTGPHLHFEVRVGESDFFTTLNPELWLVPPQGWGVVAARIMDTSGQPYIDEILSIKSRKTGQVWKAIPYAGGAANSDPYYQENMVISDLPAGLYDVTISYAARFHYLTFEIFPGRVTYFTFKGREGFSLGLPPAPGEDFIPFDVTPDSP